MTNGWVLLILSYFIGSIPVGMLVARAQGIDIMKEGSGNVGATNIARVLGKKAGALCLFLDVLKGLIPALVFQMIVSRPIFGFGYSSDDFALVCGGMAMVGHMFSPFLKFKGGKGIATGLGMLIGSAPLGGLSVLIGFGITFAITRIVSLSSLVAVTVMVVFGLLLPKSPLYTVVYIALGAFIFWKHKPNIQRLLKGEEKKFEFGKKNKDAELDEEAGETASQE